MSPRPTIKAQRGDSATSVPDKKLSQLWRHDDHHLRKLSRAHESLSSLSWLRNVRLVFQWLFCPLTMAEALCCISVDIDAVAGWLGSYGGEDSTSDISRGVPVLIHVYLGELQADWSKVSSPVRLEFAVS